MTASSSVVGRLSNKIRPGTEVAGGFFRMSVLTAKALRRPFEWREFIWTGWFLMRVSLLPTIAVSIPETVLLIFTLNVLLAEFGAADVSGAGAGIGAVTQLGPIVTVLVVAGAGEPRSAPTWAPGPSAKRSMRSRCWASTRSTGWWYPVWSPPRWSRCCSTAW